MGTKRRSSLIWLFVTVLVMAGCGATRGPQPTAKLEDVISSTREHARPEGDARDQ